MKDENRTKADLIRELKSLRRLVKNSPFAESKQAFDSRGIKSQLELENGHSLQ